MHGFPEIKILYQDDDIVVVDKPAGVVVNKAESQKDNITLQDWIYANIEPFKSGKNGDDDFWNRGGMVHRIDKETSGILVVAKNLESFEDLQAQFKERIVKKKYLAVVYGDFAKGNSSEIIEVDAPIARNPNRKDKFAIVAEGKQALTRFKFIKYINDKNGDVYSLVECLPETGRTHQIRVHLTGLNHPVVGDKLYSGRKRLKKAENIFERQYLHASEITFLHPKTKSLVNIKSPLPTDMNSVID